MCGPADMWEPLGLWEPADMCGRWELPAGWCKHANTSSSISGEVLVLKRQWISFLCIHFLVQSTSHFFTSHKKCKNFRVQISGPSH